MSDDALSILAIIIASVSIVVNIGILWLNIITHRRAR